MCAYYEDAHKIKKGDRALYYNDTVVITSAKHVKENKTMDIVYHIENEEEEFCVNVPYKTADFGFVLLERKAD